MMFIHIIVLVVNDAIVHFKESEVGEKTHSWNLRRVGLRFLCGKRLDRIAELLNAFVIFNQFDVNLMIAVDINHHL